MVPSHAVIMTPATSDARGCQRDKLPLLCSKFKDWKLKTSAQCRCIHACEKRVVTNSARNFVFFSFSFSLRWRAISTCVHYLIEAGWQFVSLWWIFVLRMPANQFQAMPSLAKYSTPFRVHFTRWISNKAKEREREILNWNFNCGAKRDLFLLDQCLSMFIDVCNFIIVHYY